jgi:hypothetical protein
MKVMESLNIENENDDLINIYTKLIQFSAALW